MKDKRTLRTRVIEGALLWLAAIAGALEAVSLNSVFVGHRAWGAVQFLAILALLTVATGWKLLPPTARHRLFSRWLVIASTTGTLSVFVMLNKVTTLLDSGQSAAAVAPTPTSITLLVQLGLAIVYSITVSRRARSVPAWGWAPAAGLGPAVLAVGLLMAGSPAESETVAATVQGPGEEVFDSFPTAEDYPWAVETERRGKSSLGSFAHYHTGRQPLLGLHFSVRSWMGEDCVSNDLRGVFHSAEPEAGHVLMASPGYAVSAMKIQADEHVNAVRLQFASLENDALNMADTYWSHWAGGYERSRESHVLAGTGELVLGLTGSAGLVVNSIGLLVEAPQNALAR